MKFIALALSTLAAVTPLAPIVTGPLQNCGTAADGIELTELITGPDPVISGQSLNINLSGNLKTEIVTGAKVQVTVKLGVLTVFNQNFDLCDQEKETNPCPIAPGKLVTFKSGQALPDSAPRGTYNLQLKWVNADNTPLACASGRFKVEKPGLMRFVQ